MSSRLKLLSTVALMTIASALTSSMSVAQEATGTPSVDAFKNCSTIESDASRLACYDKAASGFDFDTVAKTIKEANVAVKKIAVLEKKAAKAEAEKVALIKADEDRIAADAQRKIDEFGLPTYAGKALKQAQATIDRTKKSKLGTTFIYMTNGHIWKKTDAKKKTGRLNKGDLVTIKKGLMSDYKMLVSASGRHFRVKRVLPN